MNEITRTGWDVLDEARALLRAAVAGVPADGWQRPTPCAEWTVAQVLQHAALDQGAWAAVISGTRASTPGTSRWRPGRVRRSPRIWPGR